jgi:hypothetical protein
MAKRQRQVVATIRFPFLLLQRLRIGNRKQKCERREEKKKIYKDKLCWLLGFSSIERSQTIDFGV